MGASRTSADGNAGELSFRFPANPAELGHVREALSELDLPAAILEDAQLLLAELFTNSIKHSGLRSDQVVRVSARWNGSVLRVDVFDREGQSGSSRFAGGIRPSPTAESGWGLYLLDQVANRWGNSPGHYWFELSDRGSNRS
jgi:anti-sigma regulatory factor (Ser/Thr protein kinase)